MLFKSQVYTQASGSVGGLTYSRNAGGMYTRGRAMPVNPNTVQQAEVRALMAQLSNTWVNVLSEANRSAWSSYAEATPITNRLGEPINISGLAMFNRTNLPRLQAGLTMVTNGPTIYDLGEFTSPSIDSIDASDSELNLDYNDSDEWASEVGSAMLVYVSRPQNVTINYFKGPYRFAGLIAGAVSPPAPPVSIPLPFSVQAAQRVFIQVRVSRLDGRLSNVFRTGGTVVA